MVAIDPGLAVHRELAAEQLNKYLQAEDWRELLQYVRNPSRVRPFMDDWYKTQEIHRPQKVTKIKLARRDWIESRDFITLGVETQALDDIMHSETGIFAIENSADGYLVDWEISGCLPADLLEAVQGRGSAKPDDLVPGSHATRLILRF